MELGVGDGEMEGTVGRRWEGGQTTVAGETKKKEKSDGEKKERGEGERKARENPWKKERGNPGEGFQPEAWTPGPRRR